MKWLKVAVHDYRDHAEMVADGHDADHLKKWDGPVSVVWQDVTRPDDAGVAMTGFPGCMECPAEVAHRIRDCVNAAAGFVDPFDVLRQRNELLELCEDMRFLLGVDPSIKMNANSIDRCERAYDRMVKRIKGTNHGSERQ